LTAQLQRVDQKLARLQSARQVQALGLAMLIVALAAAALWLFKRARATPPPQPRPDEGADTDGVRRASGRRTTDAQRQADEAERLIWQLRQGLADTMPQPSDTLPPNPDKS